METPTPSASATTRTIYDRRTLIRPLVTFLVPAFNERRWIEASLNKLSSVSLEKEIIIVDDGSTDGTRKWLTENPREGTALMFHSQNWGKGAALRTALEEARGAYAAVHDADLEYDPSEYVGILKYARQNNIKAVFGSRFLKPNPCLYKRFLWGNRALTAWINTLCAAHYTDAYTGMKLMATSVWRNLKLESNGFEIEAEIAVKLSRGAYTYSEQPVSYTPRRIEEGKKIRWKDAWKGFKTARKFTYHT